MVKEFKDFVMKVNLVEIAVAFIMALAFAAVVTSFVRTASRRSSARSSGNRTSAS